MTHVLVGHASGKDSLRQIDQISDGTLLGEFGQVVAIGDRVWIVLNI